MVEATGVCQKFGQVELSGRGLAREMWQQDAPENIGKGKHLSA